VEKWAGNGEKWETRERKVFSVIDKEKNLGASYREKEHQPGGQPWGLGGGGRKKRPTKEAKKVATHREQRKF